MKFLAFFLSIFLITIFASASPLPEASDTDCDRPNDWAPVCGQCIGTGEIKLFSNICDLRIHNVVQDLVFKEVELKICFDHINFEQFVDDLIEGGIIKE